MQALADVMSILPIYPSGTVGHTWCSTLLVPHCDKQRQGVVVLSHCLAEARTHGCCSDPGSLARIGECQWSWTSLALNLGPACVQTGHSLTALLEPECTHSHSQDISPLPFWGQWVCPTPTLTGCTAKASGYTQTAWGGHGDWCSWTDFRTYSKAIVIKTCDRGKW